MSVTQVETVDDDIGLNGEVRYVIIKDQRGDWKTFQIDEKTGNITLKLLLDREKQKKYEVFEVILFQPVLLQNNIDCNFCLKL